MNYRQIPVVFFIAFSLSLSAVNAEDIFSDAFIISSLKQGKDLNHITELYNNGSKAEAIFVLIDSLKERSRERYYFDWKDFPELLKTYEETYPGIFEDIHQELADYHTSRYAPETSWDLPFNNLLGDEVTPYELRHLARQQKSMDMALLYFRNDRKEYLDYWVRQVADLMDAYKKGEYENTGNGIFEYYRAGRRIHNWMFNHHVYYNSSEYDKKDQKVLLKTFIYHGFDLARRTEEYHPGNHHTKGLVGLFEIAIFLQDFTFSDVWIEQSLSLLTEHMRREINPDGFQFERSVHYHLGDIENYLRVYQLAKTNNIPVPELFEKRFRQMFQAMKMIAQPDKNIPVLQDDTDFFLKEFNDPGGVFKAGSLLLNDPELKYFAAKNLSYDWYWLLAGMLSKSTADMKKPSFGSIALENTGYYIMRNGWNLDDKYMSISAGLSDVKPDHQHGDMLGLTAYANGYQILPTYQVKYNKPDYYLFKNSWVKNVAIVDSIPHGLDFKGNKGGSGFGKFGKLPQPEVLLWISDKDLDIFVGTHDGYENIGVRTYRTIIFFKNPGEWIVCDQFLSEAPHKYQQIWQGCDEAVSNSTLIRRFDNGFNLEISQKNAAEYNIDMKMLRNKRSWSISVVEDNFQFITHIKASDKKKSRLTWCSKKFDVDDDAQVVRYKRGKYLILNTCKLKAGHKKMKSDTKMNLLLEKTGKKYSITNIGPVGIQMNNANISTNSTLK